MRLEALRTAVCEANKDLERYGVVVFTWGNVSGIDRDSGLVAIKPSGVSYADLTPDKIVLVDLDNKIVEGSLSPSTDTATHTVLYKAFGHVGGVCHTHSRMAVAFAQARREIPCLGTTHADYCYGPVPLTAPLSAAQVTSAYEDETGRQIIDRFKTGDPVSQPMALVAGHGPFTWGKSPDEAVRHAVILEEIATIASATLALNPVGQPLEDYVLDYHHERKHGAKAWYGQRS